MFFLHVSNRTENLLRHLGEVIQVDKQSDLFGTELFLIQSQGMERMVGQTLADEFRSFCNFKFFLPLDFLGFIADKLGIGISPDGFQRQILTWRLDALLRDISEDVYQPLHSYLTGENSSLKRFQLARRLANIFDQYQVMRSDMLFKWEKGKRATDHPAEMWQMSLWQRLLAQEGGEVHRGMLFTRVIGRLKGEDNLSHLLPKRVSVIGLHTMPPIFLEYLNSLACHMDVHLFLLSPCRHYWGNVESMRARFKQVVRDPSLGSNQPEEHHPLLAGLGTQGRDLQNMMLEGADFALEFSSYDEVLGKNEYIEATLLRQVQADLLDGSLPGAEQEVAQIGDDSIQLISCHSKLREITVLKDHLLRFLHSDPSLDLRDIIVMAPDIQEYAPLIPAVFADVQYSIADRSIRRRNTVIGAFLRFFDLFSGRFGWSEVLDLLHLPVVYPQFQLAPSDLDTIQQWVVGAGIRWGLSGQQRQEAGLPGFEETSWQAGLDRLFMGYAIDADDFIDGLLPYADIEGRGAMPLGGLCRFIELLERARHDFKKLQTISKWSETFLFYAEQLFGNDYETELVELRALLAELGESISDFHSSDVEFGVMYEWFKQSTKESRSSSGFLRGQLTFCSMLPMRSIPFKVVCLIGLNDNAFPKNDIHDTFDLMGLDIKRGDRSPRADDRYQFLEALLAARSHLYLSYIGQSIRTNDEIPPSVVMSEFLELLETGYGVKNLLIKHPLHPFSRKYFQNNEESGLFSYDNHYCQTANSLLGGVQPAGKWWQGSLDGQIEVVQLMDLLGFFANPQKYFVRNSLGIQLDLGDELPDEREVFELSGLGKYHVEQEMVRAQQIGDLEHCLKRIQVEGKWPLGTSGKIGFDKQREEVEFFVEKMHHQQMGERHPDLPVDIFAGRYRLVGTLSNIYEGGILLSRYGKLRGRDLLSGWIHHLMMNTLMSSSETRIVATDRVIRFSGESSAPDLETILTLFDKGCHSATKFYIEPAFAYATQQKNQRARISPLEKAVKVFENRLEKRYEPEWELLLRGTAGDFPLGPEFEQFCREIMCPIWEVADEEYV